MKKKQFKSESKRLLDLMINSIYTNKDIFLRELISNASDAIDKLYYKSLTDKDIKVKKNSLEIEIAINKEEKTIVIKDNGIGMTEEELENNLGTIAKSGSLVFKENEIDKKKVMDIIGQFGVGFYSAFMVSKRIEVLSKSVYSDKASKWISEGEEGYTLESSEKENNGTIITLYLKDNDEDINYDDYLEEYKIKNLIKKYSDYIKYPIKINGETINSMIPLWKKNKKNITEEDYNNFYSDKFNDYENPLKVIHSSTEGLVSYNSLLFIPGHQPYDFYTKEYEKGLSLYSNSVLIMEKCSELLPDYLSFIKGIVDSEDVSLNISREMLQKTKTLHSIAKSIESKILKELETMLKSERDEYNKFYNIFGIQLKFGVYNNYGLDKDKVKDLIMFKTSKSEEFKTLKEYIENMIDNQKAIYYISGEDYEKINNLPQVDKVKDKGYEILYLTDYVDEFAIQALGEYESYKFINISSEKLDIETDEEKDSINKINQENKELLDFIKENIDVSEIRFTANLKNHPVCLTSKGDISTEMEKVLNQMPIDQKIKSEKILEINENHPISNKIKELYKNNKEELKNVSKVLYEQARLIEGLPIENPTELSNIICDLLAK